jgi:hypothetical protein
MDQEEARKLRELGFDEGVKLCRTVIHYHREGYSDLMRTSCEVPDRDHVPMDEKRRREYMRGFGEGIVSTIINE